MAQAVEGERRSERLKEAVLPPREGPAGIVRLLGNAWTLDRLARTVMAPFLAAHPRLDLRIVTLTPRSPIRGEASLSLWFEAEPRESEFRSEEHTSELQSLMRISSAAFCLKK